MVGLIKCARIQRTAPMRTPVTVGMNRRENIAWPTIPEWPTISECGPVATAWRIGNVLADMHKEPMSYVMLQYSICHVLYGWAVKG
jgi:hypothetical protein